MLNITGSFIYAQSEMLLFGPTLHYNIGGEEKKIVFGLELSYWKMGMFSLTPPTIGQGVDIGVEFDGTKIVLMH